MPILSRVALMLSSMSRKSSDNLIGNLKTITSNGVSPEMFRQQMVYEATSSHCWRLSNTTQASESELCPSLRKQWALGIEIEFKLKLFKKRLAVVWVELSR